MRIGELTAFPHESYYFSSLNDVMSAAPLEACGEDPSKCFTAK